MYVYYCDTIVGSYFFITSCNFTKSISVSSFAKKNHTGGCVAYFINNLTMTEVINKYVPYSKSYIVKSGNMVQLPTGAQLSCVANTCEV